MTQVTQTNTKDPFGKPEGLSLMLEDLTPAGLLCEASLEGDMDRICLAKPSVVNELVYVGEFGESVSALHCACNRGQIDVVKWLVDKGGANVEIPSSRGAFYPLHFACSRGHLPVVKFLIDHAKANVNQQSKNGSTPIHEAAENGYLDICRALVAANCNPEALTHQSFSPLHRASRYGHCAVAKFLIDCGCDVNGGNADQYTPLHRACMGGYVDVVDLLISEGARVDIVNSFGELPLHRLPSVIVTLPLVRRLVTENSSFSRKDRYGVTLADKARALVPPTYRDPAGAVKDYVMVPFRHEKFLTFALGRHGRLGDESPVQVLYDDVMGLIFDQLLHQVPVPSWHQARS